MNDVLLVLLGIGCAALGGEWFVRGLVGLARWARVAPAVVGATVAAFATSSPELSVSANAALAGEPRIGLGDALGSNVVNVALILGLALVLGPLRASRDSLRRDFPVALAVPVVTGLLILDSELSRPDALLLLAGFSVWLAATVRTAWRERQNDATEALRGETDAVAPARVITHSAVGLVLLIVAGGLIVAGAGGIATRLGADPFLLGATIVAVGTSTPELVTTLVARWRGHEEIGLGTLLGSNIFNGAVIVPVTALIHPVHVSLSHVDITLFCALLALVLAYPSQGGHLGRARGAALVVLYAGYVILAMRHVAG